MTKKTSILIVDDEEDIRETLVDIFSQKDYQVETATTEQEALEKARGRYFNLALLDIKLPDMKGVELIASLKEMHPDMVVIMVTSYAALDTAMRALNEGVSTYITKPFSMEQVVFTIGETLEKQRLRHELQTHQIELEMQNEELRQIQEALQESRDKYADLYDFAPVGYFTMDKNGLLLEVNLTGADLLGVNRSNLLKQPISRFIARDSQDEFYLHRRQVFETGTKQTCELELVQEDGPTFYAQLESIARVDSKGDYSQLRMAIVDITERKQVEKLRKHEEEVRTHLQWLSDFGMQGILATDTELNIRGWNSWLETHSGHRAEDVLGRNLLKVYPELVERGLEPYYQDALAGQVCILAQHFHHYVLPMRSDIRPDAELMIQSVQIAPLTQDERVIGTITMIKDVTEQVERENILQESEELHRITLSNISDAVFITDEAGAFIYICPNADVIFGYSSEEIQAFGNISRLLGDDLFVPDELTAWSEIRNIERDITDKAGQIHSLLVNVKRVSIKGGTRLYTCRDTSERKQIEEALRESERKLRLITENMRDAVFAYDMNRQLLYANPAFKELTGYTPAELREQNFINYLHPDDETRMASLWEGIFQGKTFLEEEFRIVTKDGQTKWCSSVCSPLLDKEGRQIGIQGRELDITKRKQVEEYLRESEEQFRTSIENMLDCFGIYSTVRDQAGRIVDFQIEFVNEAACVSNLMTKEEQIGEHLCKLLPAHRETGLFDEYCQVVETGKPLIKETLIYEDVYKHQHLSRAFDIRAAKLEDGFVASWRDITKRKQAEEALTQRATQLALINDIGSKIAAVLELDSLLDNTASLIQETFGYHHVALFLVDGEMLKLKAIAGLYKPYFPPGHTQHLSEGINGWVASHGQKVVANDINAEPRYTSLISEDTVTQAELCLPIKVAGHTLGVLDIQSPHLNAFHQNDVMTMETLTHQIAVAMENARLYTETKRRAEQRAMLHELGRAITASLDINDVYEAYARHSPRLFSYHRMSITLLEGEKNRVAYVNGEGETALLVGTTLPSKNSSTYWVLEHDQALLRPNIPADMRFARDEQLVAQGIQSSMLLPLQVKGQTIGIWAIGSKQVEAYNPNDLAMAQSMANQLGIAIENARLFEQTQQEIVERQQAEEAATRYRKDLQRLSNQLVKIQEAERKRISQELHDEMGQALTAISVNLMALKRDLPPEVILASGERLVEINEMIDQVLRQIRELSLELRPAMLDDLGLVPTLRWYINRYTKRLEVEIEFKAVDFEERLSSEIETTLYRVVQEALTNITRHAQAGQIRLHLQRTVSTVTALIEDDGQGFNVRQVADIEAPKHSMGLLGIRERVTVLGGRFNIRSSPEQGTQLFVEIPLDL